MSHAGARLLVDLADELGLTQQLSVAMAATKKRRRGHDRGEVLVNLTVALADGATAISDLAILADQSGLFGEVASVPTTWRTLEAMDDDALDRIAGARAEARRAAWAAGMDPGFYVIDIDGTLVDVHSAKELATPTYKRGFGFYPLVAYLDATGEALAGMLRQGNAGSGTAEDHVVVLDAALRQLPVDPNSNEVIVRTDAGGTSHGLAPACEERGVRFIGGNRLTAALAQTIMVIPKNHWMRAISADGAEERDTGEVAEITDLVDMSRWPEAMRMLIRREEPHPGAQLTFTDVEGYRYQVFVTDLPGPDICFIEALYRGRGRCDVASATPRTRGSPTSPRPASPSTPPGCSPCSSPRTSWRGRKDSVSKAIWPEPNRNACATR